MRVCSERVRISDRSAFFFFNDTATTEIYTLSLHDALPISCLPVRLHQPRVGAGARAMGADRLAVRDRKSTRLNSSHSQISYAVFCLKKKKETLPSPRHSQRPRTLTLSAPSTA